MDKKVLGTTIVGSRVWYKGTGEKVFVGVMEGGAIAVEYSVPRRTDVGIKERPRIVVRDQVSDVIRYEITEDRNVVFTFSPLTAGLFGLHILLAAQLSDAAPAEDAEPAAIIALAWSDCIHHHSEEDPTVGLVRAATVEDTFESGSPLYRKPFGGRVTDDAVIVTFVISRATAKAFCTIMKADPRMDIGGLTRGGPTFLENETLVLEG